MFIDPKVPICPKMLIYPNIHLSQSPHAHLSQTPICPKWSFAPIAQCPLALVLVFPGAHFPPNAHLPHLPQLLICSGAHFLWCPFGPNAHFFPMPTCPNVHRCQGAHYAPKCPFAANTCLPWCSLFLEPIFSKCPLAPMPTCPKAHLSQKFSTSCPCNCAHFSWCPFFLSAHLPQMAKCPFASVPIYFTFLTQVKTAMVSAARGC